jgi:hypothetical protein
MAQWIDIGGRDHRNNKRILKCPETGRGATFNGKVNGKANGKVNALQQQGRNLYITQSNILYFWLYS